MIMAIDNAVLFPAFDCVMPTPLTSKEHSRVLD